MRPKKWEPLAQPGQVLHVALISVHGLIRGQDLELGRDADTGGQTLYVVELARALAERPDIARVDLADAADRGPERRRRLRGADRSPGRDGADRAHRLRSRGVHPQGRALGPPRRLRRQHDGFLRERGAQLRTSCTVTTPTRAMSASGCRASSACRWSTPAIRWAASSVAACWRPV